MDFENTMLTIFSLGEDSVRLRVVSKNLADSFQNLKIHLKTVSCWT